MTSIVSQCVFCTHYKRATDDRGPTCKAFPGGIPAAILRNEHDHRKPYDGDNGARFEPVDDDAARIVAEMFGDDAP